MRKSESMDPQKYASICEYVDFDETTSATLATIHPHAAPHFERIVDDFYEAIDRHPEARDVITSREQTERLKKTLVSWLDRLLRGPHDAAYVEARSRIGRVHVRINLPQQFMFTAMNRIRTQLLGVVHDTLPNREQCVTAAHAVNAALDIELAIMLDTYREDLLAKQRATERLATIGQLAASIGHELRNPLGIIESSLFLMQKQVEKAAIDDEVFEKHRARISNQIKHCGKTITDLLELARDRPPRRRPLEVASVVDSALDTAAISPEITVKIVISDGLTLTGDGDQIRQVLINLLSNAGAALDGSGGIAIEAEREKDGTVMRVRDDGPGIPKADHERVFEALYTTKAKGTGLGLALCRRIITAHGGEIGLEPANHGACFRVWLPD